MSDKLHDDDVTLGAVIEDKILEPLADYVVVVPMNWESKSIILVEASGQEPPTMFGRVVSMGPACTDKIAVGDTVLWGPFPKMVFGKGKTRYLLMKEAEIIALMKDVPETIE